MSTSMGTVRLETSSNVTSTVSGVTDRMFTFDEMPLAVSSRASRRSVYVPAPVTVE